MEEYLDLSNVDVISPHEFLSIHRFWVVRSQSIVMNHVRNFMNLTPNDCSKMLESTLICNIIIICDDIMYQEASNVLIPDCLATLKSDFSVTLRKFAKALPLWIGESLKNAVVNLSSKIVHCRKESAKQWAEHVRRVTTLCHVTKEARKTLIYPTIVVPLLHELRTIPIKEIAGQCAFAGNDDDDDAASEYRYAQRYMKRFCNLLQNEANVEVYAYELECIVDKHAGLRAENAMQDKQAFSDQGQLSTDQTRVFMMKWAAYGSKILTEITLKSSESVGPFHLVMLLFGDYISHVIALKNERAKQISRLRSVIRSDSSYFQRMSSTATIPSERNNSTMSRDQPCTPSTSQLNFTKEPVMASNSSLPLLSNCSVANRQVGCSSETQFYPGLMNVRNDQSQSGQSVPSVIIQQPCTVNVRPSAFYVVSGPMQQNEDVR